jgi:hypothetical protein
MQADTVDVGVLTLKVGHNSSPNPDKLVRDYLKFENLVLWARSEIMGSALKIIQSVK